MSNVWIELKVLRDQQASDFQATMLGMETMKKDMDAMKMGMTAMQKAMDGMALGLTSMQKSMEKYHTTSSTRLDKLEEVVQKLEKAS